MSGNPRRSNGARRRRLLSWLRASGGPCWICGLPIDQGVPQGDPLAMECDELVPVSLGGSPYDRGNVAPAHRCCNNWRRTRSVGRVARVRALVAERFGPCSSPLEFVARAKAAERDPLATVSRDPPRVTTDW